MKVFVLLIMFLFVGLFFIISENNLKLSEAGNFSKAVGLYSAWFSQIFDNSRVLTGYLVRMDWLPKNQSSTGIE